VVINNGSGFTKAGFGGYEIPTAVFPSIVGRPKINQLDKRVYFGVEAQANRSTSILKYPISHDIITDWDALEELWGHTFSDVLQVHPQDHPVLLTQSTLGPTLHPEKMAQIMFETFNVPGMYLATEGQLALYASARTTGIVLNIGHGICHIVPVYEGGTLPHATHRMSVAGHDLTQYLVKLLYHRGYEFLTSAEVEIVRDIKEKCCYVASNFDEQQQRAGSPTTSLECAYRLPNGDLVFLETERFRCVEALFQPHLLDLEVPGLHQQVHNSILKTDPWIRKEFFANVVLAGGSTLFPGMADRLQSELTELERGSRVRVTAPRNRGLSAWIGGSLLSSLPDFRAVWMTSDTYEEYGPAWIHRFVF